MEKPIGEVKAGEAQNSSEDRSTSPENREEIRFDGEEQRILNPQVVGSIPTPSLDFTSGPIHFVFDTERKATAMSKIACYIEGCRDSNCSIIPTCEEHDPRYLIAKTMTEIDDFVEGVQLAEDAGELFDLGMGTATRLRNILQGLQRKPDFLQQIQDLETRAILAENELKRLLQENARLQAQPAQPTPEPSPVPDPDWKHTWAHTAANVAIYNEGYSTGDREGSERQRESQKHTYPIGRLNGLDAAIHDVEACRKEYEVLGAHIDEEKTCRRILFRLTNLKNQSA